MEGAMAFPKLGARVTVVCNGVKITGVMTKIRPLDQTVFIETRNGAGTWVPMSVIRSTHKE